MNRHGSFLLLSPVVAPAPDQGERDNRDEAAQNRAERRAHDESHYHGTPSVTQTCRRSSGSP